MDIAFATEQMDRKARQAGRSGALGKHPADAESSIDAIKRAKIEPVEPIVPQFRPATNREIDISPLPQQTVIDMVMRGLEAISAEALTHILDVSGSLPMAEESFSADWQTNRRALQDGRPEAIQLLRQALLGEDAAGQATKTETKDEDDEILNPLDMDVEDDEDLLVSHVYRGAEFALTSSNSMRRTKRRTRRSCSPISSYLRQNRSIRPKRAQWLT